MPFKKSSALKAGGFLFSGNFLAETPIVIAIVGIVPIHMKLTIVPVGVQNIAIGIARSAIFV